jgi:TP901 family phage tail tape measure protein
MPDSPSASGGISVGDAVLTFLGDTTDLERAWTAMEQNSTASATRTVNEVMRQYDRLGIEGSVKLNQAAEQAKEAFDKLTASGVASMSDLVQAEQEVIERQIALKQSLGESIPAVITERLESLKLQYIGLTGTVAEFNAAQTRSAAYLANNAAATDQNSIALRRQAEAIAAETAAFEKEIAVLNEASAAKRRNAASGKGSGKSGAGGAAAGEEEEEGALAGGIAGIAGTAKTLALYAGIAAVAGSLADGVKQALAFDAAFAELTSVIEDGSPQSVKQIAAIKQQLLDLPPALGNITDLTHSAYQAISAGIPAGEVIKFVGDAAVYARGALTDQETATKLVAASLNAYGLTAQDTEHVTSALFATIKVGVLRGPELAESLGRVLPVANNLKVSFAEVLAAASSMTKGGLSADESMTALRQVLNTIEKPSSEAQKAMAKMGLSFADVRKEIREKGLAVGLGDLGAKIKDNTTLTAELFPNLRALTGVLALTGNQAKFYGDAVGQISEAYKDGTAAQEAFNTVTESLDGRLKSLGNTISNDFVGAFQKLSPIVESFIPSLKIIIVDSGLLRVVSVALVAVLLTLAVSLSAVAIAVEGLINAYATLAYNAARARNALADTAAGHEKSRQQIEQWKKTLDDSSSSVDKNRDAMKASLQAFDDFMRGTYAAEDANRKYAATLVAGAKASDDATIAAKKLGDAQSAAANDANDAAAGQKALQEASEKATKAMEQYANAHGTPLREELEKDISAAEKFASQMRASNQPIASQTAALINLNIQLGRLKELMEDKRTAGQTLFDVGMGKNKEVDDGSAQYAKMEKAAADAGPLIKSPLVDAFNEVLDVEKKLGIQGPVTLAKLANDAEVNAGKIREAWLHNNAAAEDVEAADAKVEEANNALAASFTNLRTMAIDKALDAEKRLGIEGTQSMIQHRNDVDQAFVDMKSSGMENNRQLMQAELNTLITDRNLKLQLGQPVPVAMANSIAMLTSRLRGLQAQMQANKKEDQEWYQFWHTAAPSTAQTMNQMANMGTKAFQDFAGSFGSAVKEIESGQKSVAAAVEEAVAKTLESISSQAAVQALYYAALGTAALFTDPAAAGAYFTAAAEFTAVAAIAGVAGALLSGGASSSAGSGASTSVSAASQGPVNPTNVQNVQRFGGGGLVTGRTLAMIGDSKNDPSRNATEAVLPLDDPEAMGRIRDGLGGSGMTVHIDGLISPDNLGKVMDQMSGMVKSGKTLVASHANRVVKKS